jgi:hypothetical protein
MWKVLLACIATRTGFTIENPKSSLLWQLSYFKALLAQDFINRVDFNMCAFGLATPKGIHPKCYYKKPGTIVGTLTQPWLLARECPNDHVHASLARQVRLLLPDGKVILQSKWAGHYPAAFCRAVVWATVGSKSC